MRKPLLLLVDDDPAVLRALEAALTPRFSEILRIEAFDDPDEVLAAVHRWSEEERPVAVAIVDQKMPGTTGVELLTHLRKQAIAAHTKPILLTGYAGLESALPAINRAGAARYLEKPWNHDELLDAISSLLDRFLEESGLDAHLVFKEVDSPAEIRRCFEIRYDVYRLTASAQHFVADEVEMDVDEYDRYSRHYTLVDHSVKGSGIIGCMRITGPDSTLAESELLTVAPEESATVRRLTAPRAYPLPLMKYLIDREAVLALHEELSSSGAVVEAGRLVVQPGSGGSSRSTPGRQGLGHHIIAAAAAAFFFRGIQHVLLTCSPPHDRVYARLGFQDAKGTLRRVHPQFGQIVVCMYGAPQLVPEPVRPRLMSIAERLRRKGLTCLCPTFPHCLPRPYETGRFDDVDLFCPIRAAEILKVAAPAHHEPA